MGKRAVSDSEVVLSIANASFEKMLCNAFWVNLKYCESLKMYF